MTGAASSGFVCVPPAGEATVEALSAAGALPGAQPDEVTEQMVDASTLPDGLLEQLYDCVLTPAGLPQALTALTAWIGADGFHLLGWDRSAASSAFAFVSRQFSGAALEACNRHYGAIDPRRERLHALAPGQSFLCHEAFDSRFVRRSEFYQDFLLRHDMRFLMGAEARSDVILALLRARAQRPFDARSRRRLLHALPHLGRALRALRYVTAVDERANVLAQSLTSLTTGVMSLDPAGRPTCLNTVAETASHDGGLLSVVAGRLRAHHPLDEEALMRGLREVRSGGEPVVLRFVARPPAPRRTVHLLLLRASNLEGPGRVIVLVQTDQELRRPAARHLAQVFGLSTAESRLVQALMEGDSVETYAARAGVSVATARSQVRAVLVKTGTRRHVELLRLAAALPAAQARED